MSVLLSIAIETYNQEKFIAQTIESILQQEYWFEYEIIIGEDCSTDKTGEICDYYASKYEQIRVIHNNPNLGAMGNYYNVLKNCSGKYFMDCAGDDYWLPGKVKSQIEFLEANKSVGMCCGKAKMFNETKNKFSKITFGSDQVAFTNLIKYNTIAALSICVRLDLLKKYLLEINPEEKKWLMEDYPQWIWFSHESRIVFLDFYNSVYRMMDDSVSHNKDIDKELSFCKNVYEIRKYYADKYTVDIEEFSENDCIFNICFDKLRFKFNINYFNRMKDALGKINQKTKKQRITELFCKNKLIFMIYISLFNIIRK